jgi:hypothetical protein
LFQKIGLGASGLIGTWKPEENRHRSAPFRYSAGDAPSGMVGTGFRDHDRAHDWTQNNRLWQKFRPPTPRRKLKRAVQQETNMQSRNAPKNGLGRKA